MTGWGLDIITDDEYQVRRSQIATSEQEIRRLPGVSELIALSLATSGFTSIKTIAEATVELLKTVPGLEGDDVPLLLKQTAEAFVEEHKDELEVSAPEDAVEETAQSTDEVAESALENTEEEIGVVPSDDVQTAETEELPAAEGPEEAESGSLDATLASGEEDVQADPS